VLENASRYPSGVANWNTAMILLLVYLLIVIVGNVVAYALGLVIERYAPAASLPAFLAMYFILLWLGWVIAVRVTQPRANTP
jgi:hypothetical protein